MKFSPEEEAILITLLYSAIFSFPLTRDELWKYLISKKKIDKNTFEQCLTLLKPHVTQQEGYVCMQGEERTIQQRIANIKEVARKQKIAEKASAILSRIPTVLFIGVSGGLAAKNVSPQDDIDFFIITQQNTMYSTRFIVLLLLQMHGLRRTRNGQHTANKICTNLFIDASELAWAVSKHDVYTAREIAQIQPLFDRENIYQKFLKQNAWVTTFLPNAFSVPQEIDTIRQQVASGATSLFQKMLSSSPLFENTMKVVQKLVMQKHKTTEIVTNYQLAFHPRDYRLEVLGQLKLKMKDLGLLTKI